jgi:hypothetical protein
MHHFYMKTREEALHLTGQVQEGFTKQFEACERRVKGGAKEAASVPVYPSWQILFYVKNLEGRIGYELTYVR